MPETLLHKLSWLAIVNAKPRAKPYSLLDGGAARYPRPARRHEALAMEYLFAGKAKTMALGTWPEVTEKEARAAHAAGRELLRKGVDPRTEGASMSDGTINAALRTLGYSGQEMTGHGFRATARTLIRERLG
jgi:hypothetical protein